MKPFPSTSAVRLEWIQPRTLDRYFELRAGNDLLGTLVWEKVLSSARGVVAGRHLSPSGTSSEFVGNGRLSFPQLPPVSVGPRRRPGRRQAGRGNPLEGTGRLWRRMCAACHGRQRARDRGESASGCYGHGDTTWTSLG